MSRTHADLPRIFRFFDEAGRCETYLRGRWSGEGTHAIAGYPADRRMSLTIDGANARVTARWSGRDPGRSIAARLRSWYAGRSAEERRIEASKGAAPPATRREVVFALAGGEYDTDFVRLTADEFELTLQVLENVRVHAVLRERNGYGIHFTGVLRKVR